MTDEGMIPGLLREIAEEHFNNPFAVDDKENRTYDVLQRAAMELERLKKRNDAERSEQEDQLFSELADAIYGDVGKGELTAVEVLQDAIRLVKLHDAETHTKSHRERLPDTRESITHKFIIGTVKGYMTVGMYEDGRPGELFIEIAKEGSTVGGLCDAIGILASIALQRGVPIEELARKFRGTSFEPAGPTMTKEQPNATSVVDYVFLWMGRRFSDDFREEYEAKQRAMEEFGK